MKKYFLATLLALLFVSCESMQIISVTCVDSETGLPIPDVQVSVNAGLDGDYNKSTASGQTDSAGFFETDLMIGCPGKCYDIYITYTKEGYQDRKVLNITEGQIELVPLSNSGQ